MIFEIPNAYVAGIGLLAFVLVILGVFSYTDVNTWGELIEQLFQREPYISDGSEISKLLGFVRILG